MSEAKMTEAIMPQQQFLLCCRNVLIRLVKHRHGGDTMAMTRCAAVLVLNSGTVKTTIAIMTWSFGEGDWKIGTRIDWTLKACSVMVGVHPKIAEVATNMVLGAIKAVILAEILG